MLEQLRHILVIRLSSLGDILLTTPALRLLRDHCPHARIDVLVKAAYHDLLRAHPCVDRVLLMPEHQSLTMTLRTVRQTHYDVVLDLHRALRSRLLYWGAVARRRLAYNKHTWRRALLVHGRWNTLQTVPPISARYAVPLRRLGIHAPLPEMSMEVDAVSSAAIRDYLAQHFPPGLEQPLLAVAPGSRWPTKRWLIDRFARVAQDLARQRDAAVVLLGDASDTSLAQTLRSQLGVPVLDCTGQLAIMQTAALLQRCQLLVCNDSGLMHMATALAVPVVAIFGPTVQEFGFYPMQEQARVVSHPLACRPCSTKGAVRCPRGHHECMEGVTTKQVLTAAMQLWEGVPG